MKNLHPARKRLLIGFLLIACTFFYAFAGTCGLIGQLIARASSTLLGQTGSTLVALVMLGVGLMLVIPHGAIGSLVRWMWHGREARVGRVVHEMDESAFAQQVAAVDKVILRRLKAAGAQGSVPTGAQGWNPPGAQGTKLAPVDRRALDDVRGALKQLGWKPAEYEDIVKGMDPKVSTEILVRDAIKQIHATSN